MRNTIRSFVIALCTMLFYNSAVAQNETIVLTGTVSYKTSSNVYIKFSDLKPIAVGDTLFVSKGAKPLPALVVEAKSSTTCVAHFINNQTVEVGQTVQHFSVKKSKEKDNEALPIVAIQPEISDTINASPAVTEKEKTQVSGRISLSNYSNFGLNQSASNHRQFAALSLRVKNIGIPQIWAEAYGNYTLVHPSLPSENLNIRSLFRVFNAAVNYDIKSGGRVSLGRKYSTRLNSVGSIDGLQIEKEMGRFYFGGLIGFRPDLTDFSFDGNLFQYGAFAGFQTKNNAVATTTTVGFVNQTNQGNTDRQYVALQHNSYVGKFNFFVSSELDVYNPTVNQLRLTNLFISARYRLKKANFMVSYDSRKRVVYYESYESFINKYLTNDVRRDGLRFRINYNFTSKLTAGASANFRIQSDGENVSNSYFGFVSYRQLPVIGGDLNISYNANFTNFLNSSIPAIRYSRSFAENRLRAYIFYRLQGFTYVHYDHRTVQNNYVGLGSTMQVFNQTLVNIFTEYSSTSTGGYLRLNLSLTQRF